MVLDPLTIITLATLATGLIYVILRSRCDQVSCCWGMLSVHRNVQLEEHERELELEHSQPQAQARVNTV